MDDQSPRLALPLLLAAQAQKEVTHNEALVRLDLAVQAAVEAVGENTPPGSPAVGACWVVGAAPVGTWSGNAHALAGWSEAGWRFIAPTEGMAVWDKTSAQTARFNAGAWTSGEVTATRVLVDGLQVLAARRPAIASPAGGTTIDAEARGALAAVLGAMRAHGLIEV